MCRFFIFIVLLFLPFAAGSSWAQEAVREPIEIGDSGKDYLRSIRLRRIDSDVAYFDPTAPAPDLKTKQQPERPSPQGVEVSDTGARWTFGIIAGTVLAVLVYLFLRFGGNVAVSLRREAQNPVRKGLRNQPDAPAWAEKLNTLEEILRIEDRRRALVLLARKALATTVAENGVLMQKSWTARDALRHIPAQQMQLGALKALVMASERVQFGGRDVSEDEFREHVDGCRQLLRRGA